MDLASLEFRLTADERGRFEAEGYLVVPGAIPAERLARLDAIGEELLERRRAAGLGPHEACSQPDVIGHDEAILEMIDCAATFPKVWGILGWNIYLYHSHLDVTPTTDPKRLESERIFAWHQDSMRVNDEIESSPRPRLSLKIGYLLSDLTEPDRGNTLVIPGSHLRDDVDVPLDGRSSPPGAVQVCAPAGSALIIDRRIWHSRSANVSAITRKVLWLGYAYRWLRPKDAMTVEHLYPKLDPIRRQLLGDRVSNDGYYAPTDADVPLRGWLAEHAPEDVAWAHAAKRQSFRPDIV